MEITGKWKGYILENPERQEWKKQSLKHKIIHTARPIWRKKGRGEIGILIKCWVHLATPVNEKEPGIACSCFTCTFQADARCTQRYCWCTKHLMRKEKIPLLYFKKKKNCAPGFSYSAIFLLPLLPWFPLSFLFFFRELCLGLPRASLLHPRGGCSSFANCLFVPCVSASSSSVLPRASIMFFIEVSLMSLFLCHSASIFMCVVQFVGM